MKTLLALCCGMLLLAACRPQNLLVTERSGPVSELLRTDSLYQHRIQQDDKVSVSIWNHDDLSFGSIFSIYNSNQSFGKWILVDDQGNVKLPKLGLVHLEGLTCAQASDTIASRYAADLIDPLIVVKILNREVTILGEVRTPGTYLLEKERNSISEVLGRAQGFTTYANLERIQLIRNGTSYIVDLTTLDERLLHTILVEADDVLCVPARRSKSLEQKAPVLIPFSSALTALAVAFSLIN